MGFFPDRREVRGSYREVKERGKIGDGASTEMF